jgi:hypothetical protein
MPSVPTITEKKWVETAMTEAATTSGTPRGDLYVEALQKREFVYAVYNKGDRAEQCARPDRTWRCVSI